MTLVYVITFIQQSTKRNNQLFNDIMREAVELSDFEVFAKYQSLYYKLVDRYETIDFSIFVYDIVSDKRDTLQREWFVMVLPKNQVKHATQLKDEQDQTQAIFTNVTTGANILNTKTHAYYKAYAMSYGIEVYGFYYYAIEINKTLSLRIELFDYDRQEILIDEKLMMEMDRILVNPPEGYTLGFSSEEIKELLDLNRYLRVPMIISMSLFFIVDITTGYFMYKWLNKKGVISHH